VPPIDVRPADSPALPDPDSEDEREGIGENLCQPPPLLFPLSRADVEPPELPRVSGRDEELFCGPVERDPAAVFCPDWPKRWDPLFERLFELMFELLLPGRETSRLFPADLLFDAAAVVPWAEKKCWFCDTFRVVEAAAGRPLAE
jgi:hypothetical protein